MSWLVSDYWTDKVENGLLLNLAEQLSIWILASGIANTAKSFSTQEMQALDLLGVVL